MAEPVYLDMTRRPRVGWKALTLKEWFMWPTVCHKVIAPRRVERTHDLFQRSILNLARSGVTHEEELADMLGLDSALVNTIRTELSGEGFLNEASWKITESGMSVLDDEYAENGTPTVGYVFQNIHTGMLYDRFVEDPTIAEVRLHGDGCLLKRFGLKNDIRAFKLRHTGRTPERPSASAVQRAVKRYERLIKQLQHAPKEKHDLDADDLGETDDYHLPDTLEGAEENIREYGKVQLIDETPQLCYVAMLLYSSEEYSFKNSFRIQDPFGLDITDEGHLKQFASLAQQEPRSAFAARFRKLGETSLKKSGQKVGEILVDLSDKARESVHDKIGFEVQHPQNSCKALLFIEEALLEMDIYDKPDDQKRTVEIARNMRVTVEHLVKALRSHGTRKGLENIVRVESPEKKIKGTAAKEAWWKKNVKGMFERIAAVSGFTDELPSHIILKGGKANPFVNRYPKVVESATSWKINEQVIIAMVQSSVNPEHPMRKIGRFCPDFPSRLFAQQDALNPAAHGSEVETDFLNNRLTEFYDLARMMFKAVNNKEIEDDGTEK